MATKKKTKAKATARTAPVRISNPMAVVEAFFSRMTVLDTEGALAYIADNCVYQNIPFHKSVGKARITRDLTLAGKALTGFQVKMQNAAVKGDVVLTERIDILAGHGFRIELPLMGTFVVKNGKITEWRDYFDWSLILGKAAGSVFWSVRGKLTRSRD